MVKLSSLERKDTQRSCATEHEPIKMLNMLRDVVRNTNFTLHDLSIEVERLARRKQNTSETAYTTERNFHYNSPRY